VTDDFPRGESGTQDQSKRADDVLGSLRNKGVKLWFVSAFPGETAEMLAAFNSRYNDEIVQLGPSPRELMNYLSDELHAAINETSSSSRFSMLPQDLLDIV